MPGCLEAIRETGAEFTGLSGSSSALFAASLFKKSDNGLIIVVRNNREASEFFTDLHEFVDERFLFLLPSKETLPYDESEPYSDIIAQRVIALHALLQQKRGIFILLYARLSTDIFRNRCSATALLKSG
jgi:transcription-repair coupling factor (superfamily II helicase)